MYLIITKFTFYIESDIQIKKQNLRFYYLTSNSFSFVGIFMENVFFIYYDYDFVKNLSISLNFELRVMLIT